MHIIGENREYILYYYPEINYASFKTESIKKIAVT